MGKGALPKPGRQKWPAPIPALRLAAPDGTECTPCGRTPSRPPPWVWARPAPGRLRRVSHPSTRKPAMAAPSSCPSTRTTTPPHHWFL